MRKVFFTFLIFSFAIHLSTFIHKFEKPIQTNNSPLLAKKKNKIKLKLVSEKKKQIVETVQSENLENLERIKERFLSNKKNVFKKETVAKNIGKFENANSKGAQGQKEKAVQNLKKLSLENMALSDLSKFKIPKFEKNEKGEQQKKSKSSISKISRTNDYIDDVPIGELTQLNTSEFKFYGFYYRIKQRLEQHWGNSLREKAKRLKRRKISSNKDRITALVVILDQLGRIVNVHLKSTSGVEELDSAAIESFNKAGPFPNPPKEMLENGKAKIEWGFVVKT